MLPALLDRGNPPAPARRRSAAPTLLTDATADAVGRPATAGKSDGKSNLGARLRTAYRARARGRAIMTRRASCLGGAAFLLLLLLLLPFAARADDAASPWFKTEQGQVRLVAAAPAADDAAGLRLGLEFRLAPGWKIYWRSPGDAGYPPSIDWSGSTNLASAEIAWPAPHRFTVSGLETFGYSDAVVLPIAARLEQPGAAVRLHAAVDYLTCHDLCIPYQADLALDLPASGAGTGFADLIARYEAQVPRGGADAGLAVERAAVVSGNGTPYLDLRLRGSPKLAAPDVFVEGPDGVSFGRPDVVSAAADGTELRLPIGMGRGDIRQLTPQRVRLTIVDGARAVEREAMLVVGDAPPDRARLASMLAIALLGGLVLNFMPCVLPVLSIKLLGLIAKAGQSRREIRLGFLASSAGILVSFLTMAAVLIGMKSAGFSIGWGIQFQQPAFLVGMIALLTVMACNLAGLFEIPLPGWLGSVATRAGVERRGLAGDFAAGAFATLLATPCSAPFLGTAVGFGLAGSAFDTLTIFLALGVGLAAPYLLVAAVPALAAMLPRPGRWMLGLRRVLGGLLGLTALWLLSVLGAETGLPAAAAVGILMALVGLSFRIRGPALPRRAAIAALLLLAVAVPALAPAGQGGRFAGWQEFDPAAIERDVRQGKTVLVDVTADWCLTCQVNERLVLRSDAVKERLARPDVVAMRADWTRPSEEIAAYLRGFGRYGIPFNAVYGPRLPNGKPLSEVLTEREVLDTVAKAGP
jgi:suppressor for copper-sensitivity B